MSSVPRHTRAILGLLALLGLPGCATYTQDLERARRHYQDLEFPQALSVLRLLGEDYDVLSPAEQVQFAYLRGMTDFRLSETVPAVGTSRTELRACSRDWLQTCFALDTAEGALSSEQITRARVVLGQLIDVEAEPRACLLAELRQTAQ